MKADKVVAQDAAKRAVAKGARGSAAAATYAAATRDESTATLGDMKQIPQGQNKEFERKLLAMQKQYGKQLKDALGVAAYSTGQTTQQQR